MSPIIDDAVDRGEAPSGTDAAEVIRYLSAPLYYTVMTATRPLTTAEVERAVAATLAAVRPGVFIPA